MIKDDRHVDWHTTITIDKTMGKTHDDSWDLESLYSAFNASELGSRLINPKDLESSLITIDHTPHKKISPVRELDNHSFTNYPIPKWKEKRVDKIGSLLLL